MNKDKIKQDSLRLLQTEEGWTHGRKHSEVYGETQRTGSTGKEKESILEIQEINDFFADMELEAEQMEKVLSIWKPTILMYCVSAVTMIWT